MFYYSLKHFLKWLMIKFTLLITAKVPKWYLCLFIFISEKFTCKYSTNEFQCGSQTQGGDLYDDDATQTMQFEFGPMKTYIQEPFFISIVELDCFVCELKVK